MARIQGQGTSPGRPCQGCLPRQFTVTIGPVLERFYVRLSKRLLAGFLLCSFKSLLDAADWFERDFPKWISRFERVNRRAGFPACRLRDFRVPCRTPRNGRLKSRPNRRTGMSALQSGSREKEITSVTRIISAQRWVDACARMRWRIPTNTRATTAMKPRKTHPAMNHQCRSDRRGRWKSEACN